MNADKVSERIAHVVERACRADFDSAIRTSNYELQVRVRPCSLVYGRDDFCIVASSGLSSLHSAFSESKFFAQTEIENSFSEVYIQ